MIGARVMTEPAHRYVGAKETYNDSVCMDSAR